MILGTSDILEVHLMPLRNTQWKCPWTSSHRRFQRHLTSPSTEARRSFRNVFCRCRSSEQQHFLCMRCVFALPVPWDDVIVIFYTSPLCVAIHGLMQIRNNHAESLHIEVWSLEPLGRSTLGVGYRWVKFLLALHFMGTPYGNPQTFQNGNFIQKLSETASRATGSRQASLKWPKTNPSIRKWTSNSIIFYHQ